MTTESHRINECITEFTEITRFCYIFKALSTESAKFDAKNPTELWSFQLFSKICENIIQFTEFRSILGKEHRKCSNSVFCKEGQKITWNQPFSTKKSRCQITAGCSTKKLGEIFMWSENTEQPL